MSLAESVVTGPARKIEDALTALRRLGTVDESTITIEELTEIEINGKMYQIPATKVTAEVAPIQAP